MLDLSLQNLSETISLFSETFKYDMPVDTDIERELKRGEICLRKLIKLAKSLKPIIGGTEAFVAQDPWCVESLFDIDLKIQKWFPYSTHALKVYEDIDGKHFMIIDLITNEDQVTGFSIFQDFLFEYDRLIVELFESSIIIVPYFNEVLEITEINSGYVIDSQLSDGDGRDLGDY